MPLLRLETSADIADDKRKELLKLLSAVVSKAIGKPEQYVMVSVGPATILMGGDDAPAAFADVRSIGGLNRDVNGEITQRVCELLEKEIQIAPARVYLTFTDVMAQNWGWNGRTFG